MIGAGLAGLVSALSLQKSGYSVSLLDKRTQVGGLCGTFEMEGFEFVTGCNDFGFGLVNILQELGVEQAFEYKKSFIFYSGSWFNAAIDIKSLWKLRGDWKNMISLVIGIIAQQLSSRPSQTVEAFVDRYTKPGTVNDLAKIIGYFMGVAPYDIFTSYFKLDSQYGYGYTRMACPVGGPQVLSSAIAREFSNHGGQLFLDTCYRRHDKENERFYINAENQQRIINFQADYLVDTTECKFFYPPDTKRGLALSMLCLAVDSKFPYSANTHTLSYYEPNISQWFKALDIGSRPEKFGFHVFKSDLASDDKKNYTLNIYFYLPRGVQQLDDGERNFYCNYLLERLEEMLPGIRQHLLFSRLLTPDDFESMHGLSSRVMPFISRAQKPGNMRDEGGHFCAGHTVYPPGDHAGAAALSGYLVAKSIMSS